MDTMQILVKVIPMIIAIILGYTLTVTRVINSDMINSFKKIIMCVTLPASIFSAFIKINFRKSYLIVVLCIFVASVATLYIAKLIAKVFSIKSRYFPFLLTGFETGMVGYPLFMAVYGTNAAANLGIVDIGHALFIFSMYIPMMVAVDKKSSSGFQESLRIAFRTPPFWAITIGLICAALGISAYSNTLAFSAVDSVLQFVGAPTSLLICFILGHGMKLTLKGIRISVITASVKFILAAVILSILYFFVFRNLAVGPEIILAIFVLFSMPAPFIIPIFMENASQEDISYVANTLSISSIFSVALFIVIVLFNS